MHVPCIGGCSYRRTVPPRPLAYRLPFTLEREPAHNLYRLTNVGTEVVYGVSFTLHGSGVMAVSPPKRILPLHGIEVTIAGANLARDTILVVRWFRADEVEYLWRVAF
jgi:hypothetical protein